MSADLEAMFLQVLVPPEDAKAFVSVGAKINQKTYLPMNTLGIDLETKTRQHVQIMLPYNVQPQTMRKKSQ